jgi:hypothetical protein
MADEKEDVPAEVTTVEKYDITLADEASAILETIGLNIKMPPIDKGKAEAELETTTKADPKVAMTITGPNAYILSIKKNATSAEVEDCVRRAAFVWAESKK